MPNKKSIKLSTERLTLDGVCRVAKKFANLEKNKSRNKKQINGWDIAIVLWLTTRNSANLPLRELGKLIQAFNKSDPTKDAIKRRLILEALLSANHIKQVEVRGKRKYNKPVARSPFEMLIATERVIRQEISLAGDLKDGYFMVNKVVGREKTGFGRECLGHEANIFKEEKVIGVNEIKKIKIEKFTAEIRYLLIIPF